MKRVLATLALLATSGCANGEPVGAVPHSSIASAPAALMPRGISGDLYVANRPPIQYGSSGVTCTTWVSVYKAGTSTPAEELPGLCGGRDGGSAAAFDAKGNFYWADYFNGAVLVFAPGGKKPAYTIAWGAPGPYTLTIDGSGQLFVANVGPFVAGYGRSSVSVYAHGKAVPRYTIAGGVTYPVSLATDASGNLFVANCSVCAHQYYGVSGSGNVSVYAAGKATPSRTIYDGATAPDALAVDASGSLYVANNPCSTTYCDSGSIAVYSPGATSPVRTITPGAGFDPRAIAIDRAGTLYVSNGKEVLEYPKGATTPKTTFYAPCQVTHFAFDGANNAYLLLGGCPKGQLQTGAVSVYLPGRTTPKYTITKGLDDPKDSMAIAP